MQEMEKSNSLKQINPIDKTAFIIAFILINLAFSFHTFNFMFGDHDWTYVRSPNYWSEGAFEGRPLHFVLLSVLFGGHVVPILNNLVSFAALALSGLLLAKYWRIPQTLLNYTLFAIFPAVLPYTMVWLFYAKDTLINLSLPLIAVTALLIADKAPTAKRPWLAHLLAVVLFYFAYASYAALVNFLCVCFLVHLLISYAYSKESLKNILKQNLPAIADMLIALVLFKITLVVFPASDSYNTELIPLTYLPQKFVETLKVMVAQFVTPLPFMELKYKLLLLVLTLFGFALSLKNGGVGRAVMLVIMAIAVLFASKLAFFIAEERGQILAEMENFAFVPRLDFYGLAYVYALGLALVLLTPYEKLKKLGVILACVIAFMSIVRDMYVQKVWKLGFDAEMKAHERIVTRLEERPDFYPARKYRLLQIGSLSLRENFYKKAEGEVVSLDLLKTSFTPQFKSSLVYNFYYPEDVFYENAPLLSISAKAKQWLNQTARPWPAAESIMIDGDIVIIVLDEVALNKARTQSAN
ncbi:MAG: glucosyltransferase domain-containing protein [Alphaproteobacteria bacterium]|nr:glucosyltransferase domain-containing protein [Alphaproteobacteria bacterium]